MPGIRPRSFIRTASLVCALSAALVALGPAPAEAKTAVAVTMQGTGSIAPGISPTGLSYQNFNFNTVSFTITGVIHDSNDVYVLGNSSCTANGGSLVPESIATGAGTGAWACFSGPMAGKDGLLTYVRTGGVVSVATSGALRAALACSFQADQTPPATITSFHLTCAGAGKHAIPGVTDPDPTD